MVNELDSVILNYLMANQIESLTKNPKNVTEWQKANKRILELQEIAKDRSSNDWFRKVDEYYVTWAPYEALET